MNSDTIWKAVWTIWTVFFSSVSNSDRNWVVLLVTWKTKSNTRLLKGHSQSHSMSGDIIWRYKLRQIFGGIAVYTSTLWVWLWVEPLADRRKWSNEAFLRRIAIWFPPIIFVNWSQFSKLMWNNWGDMVSGRKSKRMVSLAKILFPDQNDFLIVVYIC